MIEMTDIAEKVRQLVIEREGRIRDLEKAYDYEFDNLQTNEYGEVDAASLSILNKWHKFQLEQINRDVDARIALMALELKE